MAKRPLTPSVVPATLVVAASNSLHPERADYRCTGINDHLVIQAALDALPATGGEVLLLDGTYNIGNNLVLDSYQTLKGCGWNTILIPSVAYLEIVTATGTSGSEKIGIIVSDLQINGNDLGNIGVQFEYVHSSIIKNVYAHGFSEGAVGAGILLTYSDFSIVVNNLCTDCYAGIELSSGGNAIVTQNTCRENSYGIWLYSATYNIVTLNNCRTNNGDGIIVESSNHNSLTLNSCSENSQTTTNTWSDIYLSKSDYNNIQGNTCRAGALANKPRYGINISDAACDGNLVTNNDLYNDGFGTGSLNDAGTGTVTAAGNRV